MTAARDTAYADFKAAVDIYTVTLRELFEENDDPAFVTYEVARALKSANTSYDHVCNIAAFAIVELARCCPE